MDRGGRPAAIEQNQFRDCEEYEGDTEDDERDRNANEGVQRPMQGLRQNRNNGDHRDYHTPITNPMNMTFKPEPFYGKESWEEYHSHFEDCAE